MAEIDILRRIIAENMGYREGDKILIVTDNRMKAIARLFYRASVLAGSEAVLMEMKARSVNGEEPPPVVAEAMLASDIIFLVTHKSLTHTKARRDASSNHARIASLPHLERKMIEGSMDIDYRAMESLTVRLGDVLRKTSAVRITTAAGTDITMDIRNRAVDDDTGYTNKPGMMGNLPAGESSVSPVEGSANGIIVVDGSFPDVLVKEPIRIAVRSGYAESIEGGAAARKLRAMLDAVKSRDAFAVAELGIGTNPGARITGNVLEDEKALGTAHIALGNNKSYGGMIDVPIHIDNVIRSPDIYADGKKIMEKGRMLV